MANYMTLVLTASFFAALVSSLLKENGIGKSARAIVNIAMMIIVVLPILKSILDFSDKFDIPVINENYSHIIDNKEEDTKLYREWLAKVTATELAKEIEASVKEGTGITVRVECPWHFKNNDVVFDKIKIYTRSQGKYYDAIKNYVKLHFSLDSECFEEV